MILRSTNVLSPRPNDVECEEIAADEAEGYDTYWWTLTDEIPEGLKSVADYDQLMAHLRDAGSDAGVLTIWMTND